MNISDQIAQRVNCYGITDWLRSLVGLQGAQPDNRLPVTAVRRHEVSLPEQGITLVLTHPHADHSEIADEDRWVLESALFDPVIAVLPFGLDARSDTATSAIEKLSDDTVEGRDEAGNSRVSYFLQDARVVELTFTAKNGPLTGVRVARLGAEMAFDHSAG